MSRRAPLIAMAVVVLVAVVAVFLLVLPKSREVQAAREELEVAQGEELGLQVELSRLEDAAENAPQVRRALARFRRRVPPVADLPGLINLLQDAADVSRVDFFSVSPGAPVVHPSGQASQIPAAVQIVGGFFQVDEFLFRLETLQREAKVSNITVGPGPGGLPQLDIRLSVEFFTTDTTAGPGTSVEAQ